MKIFTTEEIIDLLNQVMIEEISFSQMVEILNERMSEEVSEAKNPNFKEGDFLHSDWDNENVTIIFKNQESYRVYYHASKSNYHGLDMNDELFWNRNIDFQHATEEEKQELLNALAKEGKQWNEEKKCIEDIPDELKKGDLAIFWDNEKKIAVIKSYDRSIGSEEDYFLHKDQNGFRWRNAIKFESKEQYERLIKGEI